MKTRFTISIQQPKWAFLPEVRAYSEYFQRDGRFLVHIEDPNVAATQKRDAQLLFMGLHPRWKSYSQVTIGDYNSMSTGSMARLKDFVKGVANVRPNITVALNDSIVDILKLDKATTVIRPMGYFGQLLRPPVKPEYDLVYSGSVSRPTVIETLNQLSSLGLKIVVIGPTRPPSAHRNLIFLGPQPLEVVYEIYSKSRWGLNVTPNVYPYMFQDSTKVVEYSAAGLGIVTNFYDWIWRFEADHQGRFLNLENIKSREDIESFHFKAARVDDLEWKLILEGTELADRVHFLLNAVQ